MNALFLIIAFLFVLSVLMLVAYSIFEVTAWGRHKDHYRDAAGQRRFDSPRLD
jgi:hypothetical protein